MWGASHNARVTADTPGNTGFLLLILWSLRNKTSGIIWQIWDTTVSCHTVKYIYTPCRTWTLTQLFPRIYFPENSLPIFCHSFAVPKAEEVGTKDMYSPDVSHAGTPDSHSVSHKLCVNQSVENSGQMSKNVTYPRFILQTEKSNLLSITPTTSSEATFFFFY